MESDLRKKAKEFLETPRKYSCNLKYIIKNLENEEMVSEAILLVRMVFSEVLRRRTMFQKDPTDVSEYVDFLKQSYKIVWTKLLSMIANETSSTEAMVTLFEFLSQEGKFPIQIPKKGHYYFPCDRLKMILKKCFSTKSHFQSVKTQIDEYTNSIDVAYYLWLLTPKLLEKLSNPSEQQVSRILTLLQRVPIPSEEELRDPPDDVLLCYSKHKPKFKPKYSSLQESIQSLWNIISRWNITNATHKKVLILLIESIMENLAKPVLTMDYLMESLNSGGSVSLLALQGIFILVKDHNLEYPNIYGKLYSFFHQSMFHTKYKSRLYVLSNIFLSSTHLPETLVASFIKRFARLCLQAPPQDIVILSTFIGNLLIRHPGLKILIHNPTTKTVTSDPFQENEQDPLKTNAIESSLWELETLQQHVLPTVSKAVSFINKPLPHVEWDLTDLLETTYNQIFENEMKRKVQKVSITFEKPESLTLPGTTYLTDFWN